MNDKMKSSAISYCKEKMKRKWYIPGPMFGPFSFINVFSGKAVNLDAQNDGMKNMVEVAVIVKIMQLLYKECASSNKRISIAVLSPYDAQVECMHHKIENHYKNNEFFNVKVGFVYEDEKVDILIISTVGVAECIEEINRNITDYFTRARHCLWILGDENVHLKRGSIWESLILDAKASRCFFQADAHIDLAKVIVEVKKDLHQLDELLSGETTLFQNTTWKVLFSNKFMVSFSRIESWDTKKLVLLMLLKLSTGWRPKRTSTAVFVSESLYSDIMREFKVRELHLICTVDINKETHYTQVLKVWDIMPFNEIDELVKRLERIIGTYTPEYIDCCKARSAQRGSELPMKWPLKSAINKHKIDSQCDEMYKDGAYGNVCVEKVKVSESLIPMKFFSLSTASVKYMISGCDGGDLGLPFELTEQEKDAVFFNKSSFILGRSGTGKTTVLTMKVFQNEQLHHLACEGFHEVLERNDTTQDVLRQLYVTFNPKLCYAVKQHVDELRSLTCGGSLSSQNTSLCIHDIDKMMFSEDFPDHFVHLSHDVYPLVLTFHRFLLMLDGTVGTSYFERFPSIRKVNQTSNSRLVVWRHYMSKDVTYERFCSIYWPHFNNKLTKSLDPSMVYTEIMSVIKGGLTANKDPCEILSRDDYVALSDSRTSIFNAQKREIIYYIFLQYEKKKGENEHFDMADLVNDLLQRLEVEGYMGDMMDYVFIDEVQDLSMRQIMLFKYVCTNVHEGFSFSGDTAQAIAKGIGFRFEDIRSMFFRKFLSGSEKGKLSKMFQLSENFRTHAGVLNLAQSIVNLLCHFFPLFVDVLSPETSQIGGELPCLLENDANNNAIEIIFGKKGDSSQQITGFGAEQVVLVRDESLKEKVVNIAGNNAIVLTIMESKGLEFQDVLLYDYFSTSPFSNEWRIIYEYLKEKEFPYSSFNMEKHAVLCSELKQLYVAITRTKQRLWICESTGFSEPIYDYWKQLSLVEVKQLSDVVADEMQISSSSNEWRSRGIKLFHEKNFTMARMCFLKAGDTYSERLSEAYQLHAAADSTWASQLERKKLFKDAADLFACIGKNELAAECLYEMEDYTGAGDMYLSESKLEKAVHCFYLAKRYELAAEAYEKVGAFSKCLTACCDGKLFEMGFHKIHQWGGCGDAEQEFLHKGALYYFHVKDLKHMMMFVRSFHSKDQMREFLKGQSCFDELILLELEWGNFEEAGKVARLKISHVTKDQHKYGLQREMSLVILWHVFLNSRIFQSTEEPFTQKDELLRNAVCFAERDSDVVFYNFVCKESEILSEGETEEELLKRGIEFVYCYKEYALAMSFEWVKSIHEIKKIEKAVLDRIRSFLKSVKRLTELRLLDEVCGEFVEASSIGNEDDQSLQAVSRILWYVFFGSLWAHGQRALPLKNFTQKSELLDAANSFLMGQLNPKYAELVRTEIRVLSGVEISLSQMCRYLREMPRVRSLRIHFLISRRILDGHLRLINKHSEDVLSKNFVSVEGLIYFWSYWKELIWELINCNAGTILDFNFNYFGLRKYQNDRYVLLNSEAQWVKQMHPKLVRNGYLYIIDAREFSCMAARYWSSELLYVTERVLRELQSLYDYLTKKSFPVHLQTKVLISLFEVGKSPQKHELPYSQYKARLMVDQYCQPCINHFLGNVFPINWINTQSKEMISLRGNESFLNMLNEAITINTKSQKGLTSGQLGRIAMIFLGSKLIGFNDGTKKKVEYSSQNWRDLFMKLDGGSSSSRNEKLVISLHNVLKETYSAGWSGSDCMSPTCFLYLMERVLILSFCSQDYVVTTRSSCVDWLAYEAWDMGSSEGYGTSSKTMKIIQQSLASMVIEMLNSQEVLKEWVTRSKEPESSYSILVMRLTVLLSLICANSGEYYYDHLLHLFRSTHFLSLMPHEFQEALTEGIQEDSLVDFVAIACEKTNNPFVFVSFTEDFSEAPCRNAILLNMKKLDFCQESVIKVLYPEKCNDTGTCSQDHGAQESEFQLSRT